MDKNLMAKDEMKNLGLEFISQASAETEQGTTQPGSTGAEQVKG
jgi:hypothetical protein